MLENLTEREYLLLHAAVSNYTQFLHKFVEHYKDRDVSRMQDDLVSLERMKQAIEKAIPA